MKHIKSLFLFTISIFILNSVKSINFNFFKKKEKTIVYELNKKGNLIKSDEENLIISLLKNKDAIKLFLTEQNLYLLVTKNLNNFILIPDEIFLEGIAQEYFGINPPISKIILTTKKTKTLKQIILKLSKTMKDQSKKTDIWGML